MFLKTRTDNALYIYTHFFTAIASADILWNWNFDGLPSGWEANEYWAFSDTDAQSYVTATTSGPYSVSQTSLMYSDTMAIPDTISLITVSITNEWEYSGWATNGESNCYLWAKLYFVGGESYTLEFDTHSWGFDNLTDELHTTVLDIPVSGGELFYLKFRSYAGASYGASATMDWTINYFEISANESSLNRNSWAKIKSTFN